jgi:hypothetical protein
MENPIDQILDKLMSHYQVSTISHLAQKMEISQQTISAWKSRNSITAIKKRCRELGVYEEIFRDINVQSIHTVNGGQVAQTVKRDQISSESDFKDIDPATLELIKEAYMKAKNDNRLKEFRIHMMSF